MNTFQIMAAKIGALALTLMLVFPFIEPAVLRAQSADDSIVVTQSVTSGISISSPSDINLTALSTTQDSAVGSAAWTVTTNNQAGYTLDVKASTDPALRDGSTSEEFTDYTEGVSGTPETWSVSSAYEFGFSAYGTHVPGGTWGTDTDCLAGANVPSAGLKWRGFDGTTDIEIASASSETGVSGVASTLCVATEQDGVFAPSGTYQATITATATVQ
jgi:hypothetical protein